MMDSSIAWPLRIPSALGIWLARLRRMRIVARWKSGPAGGAGPIVPVGQFRLSPQQTLHLLRVRDRWVLLAVSPTACTLLDSSPWAPAAASAPQQEAEC